MISAPSSDTRAMRKYNAQTARLFEISLFIKIPFLRQPIDRHSVVGSGQPVFKSLAEKQSVRGFHWLTLVDSRKKVDPHSKTTNSLRANTPPARNDFGSDRTSEFQSTFLDNIDIPRS